MQYPVGYYMAPDGSVQLASFWALLLNPWAGWQYAHTMTGAAITGAFVMAAVGAYYLLENKFVEQGRIFVKTGVIAGCVFSILQLFPTGDGQGKMVATYQPVTLAAMEGLFQSQRGAPVVLMGQPNDQQGEDRQSAPSPRHAQHVDLPSLERACGRAQSTSPAAIGPTIFRFSTTATTSWWA